MGSPFRIAATCAMGDRDRAFILNFDWATLDTPTLAGIFQLIWTVLRQRLIFGTPTARTDSAPSETSWDLPTSSSNLIQEEGLEAGANNRPLLEPWSCGYRCRWCQRACTRAEGHTRHSCYEHRHRR